MKEAQGQSKTNNCREIVLAKNRIVDAAFDATGIKFTSSGSYRGPSGFDERAGSAGFAAGDRVSISSGAFEGQPMNKKLALVEETEIAEIKRKHESIFNATQTVLASAIEVGEWFLVQHERIEHGDWIPWLSKNFPEITTRTIQRYILLAKNKEFLETKFQIRPAESFLEWPSIRNALRETEASKPKPKHPDPEPEAEADDDVSFPFDKDGEPAAEKLGGKPKPKPAKRPSRVQPRRKP